VQQGVPSFKGAADVRDRALRMLDFPPGCDFVLRTPPWAKPRTATTGPCKSAVLAGAPRGPPWPTWQLAATHGCLQGSPLQLHITAGCPGAPGHGGSAAVPPGVGKFSSVTRVPSAFAQLPHLRQRKQEPPKHLLSLQHSFKPHI